MLPFTLKINGRKIYHDEVLIYRDLVYRRNLRTGEFTVELVRQKVVHKNWEKYFKFMIEFWHHSDIHLAETFVIFAETWIRVYLKYNSANFSESEIDLKVKNLVNLLPRTKYKINRSFYHFLVTVKFKESLLYFRDREDQIGKLIFPRKEFDALIVKVEAQINWIRKFQASSPIQTPLR